MNETNLNDGYDPEYEQMLKDQMEFKQLQWEMLEVSERILMKAYTNNLSNNKKIHVKLAQSVQDIMDRYPDFDTSCVP